MQEYGEKAIALVPNDVSTLALMAQTLPRRINASTPAAEAAQLLAKAEQYSKQAIEIAPTLPKPANMTDETFAAAKNQEIGRASCRERVKNEIGAGVCNKKRKVM